MKIAIIGAGLTGLTAANRIREYAHVKVFEKESVGGLLASHCNDYCIEKYYHHCFRFDDLLINEIKKYGLKSKLEWRVAKTGFEIDGKIIPVNTPIEILRFPLLTFREKIKLTFFTLRSRKKDYREYDDVGVIDGLKSELGERITEKFFIPLIKSKFGENAEKVSYAWLLARVAIRSNRKFTGEEIGYLRNGFWQLIDRMSQEIEIVRSEAKITKSGKWIVNGEDFDAVIFTAPLPSLGDLRTKLGIPEIPFQSSVCMLIAAEKSITDNIYWTNITSKLSFGAIIEHTNFMPFEDYGEHLIYLASYSTPNGRLFNLENGEIKRLFLSDLKKLGVSESDVRWTEVFKAKYSGPIYERGYASKITPYRIADGFYLAGMTSRPNYPERSMNGSIRAGLEVSNILLSDFGFS